MATRDLTTRFLRCRSSTATKRPRDASQTGAALLGGGSAAEESQWATGSLAGMHPQYVDLMDDVNADIAGIKSRGAWACWALQGSGETLTCTGAPHTLRAQWLTLWSCIMIG